MSNQPTLILIHGSWHRPNCYDKIIKLLQEEHNLKCIAVALPSTMNNPSATFKDDLDAAQEAISSETTQGRNVVVVAHSYGGMVGNSAIKGFAKPNGTAGQNQPSTTGSVIGLILIASGCTLTGMTFMDPFFGHPPPSWRVNNETGYAELVVSPRELFYHDLPQEEGEYWVSQLTNQSLKALFEGGEYSYAGWLDVPVWYIGTIEDKGLPVLAQRMGIGMAREMGANIEHRELPTSHSPFLSRPEETVGIMVEAVDAFMRKLDGNRPAMSGRRDLVQVPKPTLWRPMSWVRFGIPLVLGHVMGRSILTFYWGRRVWRSIFN